MTSRGGRQTGTCRSCDRYIFQLTTSRGGRQDSFFRYRSIHRFSTHDLSWRSTYIRHCLSKYPYFQLTTSRGGRQVAVMQISDLEFFQLTTSRGGRQNPSHKCFAIFIFQLTTSRGGRRCARIQVYTRNNFSTHDLSWRSTFRQQSRTRSKPFSTHDLSWRSTKGYAASTCRIHFSTHDLSWRSTERAESL